MRMFLSGMLLISLLAAGTSQAEERWFETMLPNGADGVKHTRVDWDDVSMVVFFHDYRYGPYGAKLYVDHNGNKQELLIPKESVSLAKVISMVQFSKDRWFSVALRQSGGSYMSQAGMEGYAAINHIDAMSPVAAASLDSGKLLRLKMSGLWVADIVDAKEQARLMSIVEK